MVDIAKCASGCERQHLGYRWTAPADKYRQVYAEFTNRLTTGDCPDFIPNGAPNTAALLEGKGDE